MCVTEFMEGPIEDPVDPLTDVTALVRYVVDTWGHFNSDEFCTSDDGRTIAKLVSGGRAAYGAWEFEDGVHEWRVHIDRLDINVYIGVARRRYLNYFYEQRCGYAYIPVSPLTRVLIAPTLRQRVHSQDDGQICGGGKVTRKIERSGNGDVITVRLDADAWTVQFFKNSDTLLGERTEVIPDTYQLAVTMYSRNEAVTIVG